METMVGPKAQIIGRRIQHRRIHGYYIGVYRKAETKVCNQIVLDGNHIKKKSKTTTCTFYYKRRRPFVSFK